MDYGAFSSVLGGVLGGLIVIPILLIAFGVASYVLGSLAIYKLSKLHNLDSTWLSFIPIASSYMLGQIIDSIKGIFNGDEKVKVYLDKVKFSLLLPLTCVLPFICRSMPSIIVTLVSAITLLISTFGMYLVYCKYANDKRVLYTVLSFVPFVGAIVFFSVAKKASGVNITKSN